MHENTVWAGVECLAVLVLDCGLYLPPEEVNDSPEGSLFRRAMAKGLQRVVGPLCVCVCVVGVCNTCASSGSSHLGSRKPSFNSVFLLYVTCFWYVNPVLMYVLHVYIYVCIISCRVHSCSLVRHGICKKGSIEPAEPSVAGLIGADRT